MSIVSPSSAHKFVVRVCIGLGSDRAEAHLVADQLVGANLAGHDSHGIGMLPSYVAGAVSGHLKVNQFPKITTDAGALVVFDGQSGFGQVNGYEAMKEGVERARQFGVAIVGLRNSYHIGRIGHWAEQCAQAKMASVHFVNVIGHTPLVAPHGGAESRFGTNPFCAAVPGRGDEPAALLDMATSIIAGGKARVAYNKGDRVPMGTVIDSAGQLSDDPAPVMRLMNNAPDAGALVAFGEHKGSGLAIMCELLSAALLGGETSQPENARDSKIINNMLSLIIDPSATGEYAAFSDEVDKYLAYIAETKPRNDTKEVLLPGQPEAKARIARAQGFDVDAVTVDQLSAAALAAGIDGAITQDLLGISMQ
ncbi:MAG: malate/lactate/ureidoglycolate dehydrogenase [Actinomycetota bacterium]|jgi:uncharacterized oxidoreductase|nr:malate/lactate/ureidoglycolate dehydrogenase [Acidimicrobiales bacterium]|tara:strand:- start:1073 stop:2167 length:1095 start_codon:yes stop_codon:yes gene_type:complete